MSERMSPVWQSAFVGMAPENLLWLDRQSPRLVYQVSSFVIPQLVDGERIWSPRKIEYEFSKIYTGGMVTSDHVDAISDSLSGLVERKMLLSKNGQVLKKMGRNTNFRLSTEGTNLSDAYRYLEQLAKNAGLSEKIIEEHLQSAHYYNYGAE